MARRPREIARARFCDPSLDDVTRTGIPVIAKIEKAEAVQNIDEILAAADGVMLARGDLGVEIPIEQVPLVQKRVIALANRRAMPVITATQMLRSMVDSPLPTRAEATDVANAVLDGTDAVMLSEETAIGRHPLEAVRVMARILLAAEPALTPPSADPDSEIAAVVARSASDMAARVGAVAIVVLTRTGATARRVARWRPGMPLIALTPNDTVRRQLSLVWGVRAVVAPWVGGEATTLAPFRELARATGLVDRGATVVLVGGWPAGLPGSTNLVQVTTI